MSEKLKEIRKTIDTLDNAIHDVLMERADLIDDIVSEKRKHNLQFVHPAREARMIRRLLARHRGVLPEKAVIRIWRELVGAVSLMQSGMKVSVCYTADSGAHLWDLAKDYFGSVVTMQKYPSALAGVSSVRENEASFAVLPWPSEGEADPWWSYLFYQEKEIKIVCALPFGYAENDTLENRALVAARINFDSSGEDHSFIGIEADHSVSRGRIVDVFKAIELDVMGIQSRRVPDNQASTLHLVEVNDYISADDERLNTFAEKFEEGHVDYRLLGGYAVSPTYKSLQKKQTDILPAPESLQDAAEKKNDI